MLFRKVLTICYTFGILEGIFVDNLQAVETSSHHQTKGTKGPVDNKDLDVPENYKTCTRFFKLLWDITKVGMRMNSTSYNY